MKENKGKRIALSSLRCKPVGQPSLPRARFYFNHMELQNSAIWPESSASESGQSLLRTEVLLPPSGAQSHPALSLTSSGHLDFYPTQLFPPRPSSPSHTLPRLSSPIVAATLLLPHPTRFSAPCNPAPGFRVSGLLGILRQEPLGSPDSHRAVLQVLAFTAFCSPGAISHGSLDLLGARRPVAGVPGSLLSALRHTCQLHLP